MPSRNKSVIHYGKIFIAFLAAILLGHQILSWFEPNETDQRAEQYAKLLVGDINNTISSIDNALELVKNNLNEEAIIESIVEAGNWASPKDTVIFHLVKVKDVTNIKYSNKALQVGLYKEYNELIPDSVLLEILTYQDLVTENKNIKGLSADFKEYITESWNENPSTNYYNSKDFKSAFNASKKSLKDDQKVLNKQKSILTNTKKVLNTYLEQLKAMEEE